MAAGLPTLPIELVERIVAYLKTKEVGSVRLTCRELRDKASQGSYLTLFTNRNVDLTESSLASLTNTLEADIPLARKLRDLTLTAVCYDPSQTDGPRTTYFDDFYKPPFQAMLHKEACRSKKKFTKSDKRFSSRLELATLRLQQAKHQWNVEKGLYPDLLSSAFAAIKNHCVHGELACLRLTAAVVTSTTTRYTPDAHDYKMTSSEESFLLATALDALVKTGLEVKLLDVFSKTRLCSVTCAELASYLTHKPISRLRPVGVRVQEFSLRYSRTSINSGRGSNNSDVYCCNCNTRRFRQPDGDNLCHVHRHPFLDEDDSNCTFETSLGKFLALFPSLTNLHLHEWEVKWHDSDSDPNTTAFTTFSQTAHFPYLRSLSLHGTNLTESTLLALLAKLPNLTHLTLNHINLTTGVFSKILTFLRGGSSSSSSKDPSPTSPTPLTRLHLKDIFERKRADALNPSNPTTLNHNHLHPPPPPPPLPPGPLFPPPPPPPAIASPHTLSETYLNTLLAFRLPKSATATASKEEVFLGGCFGCNEVLLRGAWVRKAELAYAFVGHRGDRVRVEGRWDRERGREFGPAGVDGFDVF